MENVSIFLAFLKAEALAVYDHRDDLISKEAIAILSLIIGYCASHFWALVKNTFNRWTGRDSYSSLYGKWNVYRLGRNGKIFDTELTIKRRWFSDKPKCTFFTRHVGYGLISIGSCKIYGTSLAIHFNRYSKRTEVSFGSFGFWLKNLGANELIDTKYGYLAGILSDGDIFTADVLVSRGELDPQNIKDALTRTKTCNASEAGDVIREINSSLQLHPGKAEHATV